MIDRRTFLQQTSIVAGATLLGEPAYAASRAKRIHFGAQTNTYGVPIKEYDAMLKILDDLHEIGYERFETSDSTLAPWASRAAECRKDFEAHHVSLIAPHVAGKFWDRATTPTEIENLRRVAGYVVKMGATHMILSGNRLPRTDGKVDTSKFPIINEGFNAAGKMCKEEGLKFCYHNHNQEFMDEPSQMNLILKETDPKLVWLNYDVGNAYPIGPKPEDFSKEHYKRIAVYHMKDVDQTPDGKVVGVDFGAGKIDLKGIVAPLLDSNWEGWLTVEREGAYPKAADHPAALLKQCRDYLKQITSV